VGVGGVLLYMALLGFGAMITPGAGVAGSLLELVPQPLTEYSHAPAYGLLTWLLTSGLQGRGWPKPAAVFTAGVAAMVFGLLMEILQAFVPGRIVDLGDVAFNAIGIGLAALLVVWAPDRWSSAARRAFRAQ
jgi:VanZ family protein